MGSLIGESPEMREVTEHLRRIAPSLAAVMLVGESGTGKEVAAELLHAHSARASGPFVSVNCGAIPANLVEAELFGYERGAFTGAMRQHPGYFERASGGTLFLDEITEMPIDLQAKLLRVLESGRMTRIGGTEEIPIDVRIVTATNRPSDAAVRERLLREDLFYRLAVFLVRLPPLRRRGADIELLANAFLAQLNRRERDVEAVRSVRAGRRRDAIRGPATSASSRTASSAATCCRTRSSSWTCSRRREAFDSDRDSGDCLRLPIGITMADAERELLLATLRHCGGNKRRTADVLGVSLKTVYNKLVAYGNAAPLLHAAGGN